MKFQTSKYLIKAKPYLFFIIILVWIVLLQAKPALSLENSQRGDYQHDRILLILESILTSAQIGIGVAENQKFVHVNDYLLDLSGYTREDLIGQSTRMLYPAQQEYDYVWEEKYRLIAEQKKGSVETRWIHKDGSILHILLSPSAIEPEDLSVGVVFIAIDISDRKQSEERFEKAFDSSPAPLVISDISTGRFINVNDRWVEMLGHSREEQLGRTSKELGIWSDPADRDRIVTKIGEQGFFKDEPIHFRTKSGEDRFAFWSAEVINLEGQEVLLSLIMDVTDRIIAEQALEKQTRIFFLALTCLIVLLLILVAFLTLSLRQRKHSEQKLRQSKVRAQMQRSAVANLVLNKEVLGGDQHTALDRITEAVTDATNVSRAGIWILSPDHSELSCLSMYDASLSRHSRGNVLRASDFPSYFKALSSESRISVHDALNDPRTSELSHGYIAPEGITSMLDAAVLLEGHLTGVVCLEHVGEARRWHPDEEAFASTIASLVAQVMANIHRRQAEEDRKKMESQLLQAQKMESVGLLAGGVAHDFNNLLQVMRGNIELALQSKHDDHPDARRLLSVIRSMDRAASLVQQLLLFSRKAESQKSIVDLNQEVKSLSQMLERTIPKMISLEKHLYPDVWPVFADPVQIEQALLNLVSNAMDAMPNGGKLFIETHNVELDQDFVNYNPGSTTGKHVLLTISDTGFGMDKKTMEHVFDPFFTTKEVNKGTGLGLASVYGIVKAHGGFIHCYSEPGAGTTFKIYLPAATQVDKDGVDSRQETPLQGGHENILVVDDESDIRELAREAMEMLGYRVKTAASGEEALKVFKVQAKDIDLVLLDLNMPGMGGHKCLQELLTLDSSVKVVIASGYSANGHGKDAISSGAKSFIGKPYQLKKLAAIIREALDND